MYDENHTTHVWRPHAWNKTQKKKRKSSHVSHTLQRLEKLVLQAATTNPTTPTLAERSRWWHELMPSRVTATNQPDFALPTSQLAMNSRRDS